MTEYLEINRPDKRYCAGCPCRVYCEAENAEWCTALDEELITRKTPPNCPLVKLDIDWDDEDSNNIEDTRHREWPIPDRLRRR